MPAKKRNNTDYPGVYYIWGEGARGPEKIYYIRYRRGNETIEEKAGWQFKDDMTASKASGIRANRIDNKQLSNKEKRENERKAKEAEAGKWTIARLWKSYKENKTDVKSIKDDDWRYNKHLSMSFGSKEPGDILQLEVDRVRINLSKSLKPQTVKHVLNLLDRIVNYGRNKGLIDQGLRFRIQKPIVRNIKTEDLNEDQIRNLFKAIEDDENVQVGTMLKLAFFSGMRRGEIFRLQWKDIDFRRDLITLRNPKGGQDQIIPMNSQARDLLSNHPRGKSKFVFPTDDGRQRQAVHNQVNRIKIKAQLPEDFRPFHGLRHVYASMLASSGAVDMYVLQKLLTHKSPQMTQRYAHLRDSATRRAASTAGELISDILGKKIVELKGHK